MNWRLQQTESRKRQLAKFTDQEVDSYEKWIGSLSPEEEDAYLEELKKAFSFDSGMAVLDVGAGTGTISKMLSRIHGLHISALEPMPSMIENFRRKSELSTVHLVEGFCDSPDDSSHFESSSFDVIVSRQVCNGLYDPLVALRNWHYWLVDGGTLIVVDGFYDRSSWRGIWEEEIDCLPLSACQSMALIPYLMELSGFEIEQVKMLSSVNRNPNTRTPRYIVVGNKK